MAPLKLQLPRSLIITTSIRRPFSTSRPVSAKNRIYETFVRTPDEFHTLNLLSSSSNRPLITLWTASWCPSCAFVSPILKELIEDRGIGEKEGGIGYAEIQLDAATIGDLGIMYMINMMPTLMAFSRGEPQLETKVTRLSDLKNREFLTEWLEKEAARRGAGGAGGRTWFAGLFGQ